MIAEGAAQGRAHGVQAGDAGRHHHEVRIVLFRGPGAVVGDDRVQCPIQGGGPEGGPVVR